MAREKRNDAKIGSHSHPKPKTLQSQSNILKPITFNDILIHDQIKSPPTSSSTKTLTFRVNVYKIVNHIRQIQDQVRDRSRIVFASESNKQVIMQMKVTMN